jgi:hypothetical protein
MILSWHSAYAAAVTVADLRAVDDSVWGEMLRAVCPVPELEMRVMISELSPRRMKVMSEFDFVPLSVYSGSSPRLGFLIANVGAELESSIYLTDTCLADLDFNLLDTMRV